MRVRWVRMRREGERVRMRWVRMRREGEMGEDEMGEDETCECVCHLLWVKQFVLDEGEEGRDHFRANQLADDD